MRFTPATLALIVISVAAVVFAILPVVADVPWEDRTDEIRLLRCEAALELRNRAEVLDIASLRIEARGKAEAELELYCSD